MCDIECGQGKGEEAEEEATYLNGSPQYNLNDAHITLSVLCEMQM